MTETMLETAPATVPSRPVPTFRKALRWADQPELRDRAVPAGWQCAQRAEDGASWVNKTNGLTVIESVAREVDGRRWLHVSVSRAARVPTWEDLTLVRRTFVGEQREAYSVLPPADRYVNIHPRCLHLWACLDAPHGAVLPAFEGTIGGRLSI